ncbi:D-lyxose/D-mannose family sugar isomerase [Paracoccus sp. PXZ]|uniref:D-lyxose/D-mannose family sugar isomerase n=1 Tax=Paracoccus sp. MKU1 TaxID=1745182 RepID=UPI0007194100|nr:D-lyxose/D-mannose family sugar isomerase [Paracoccus sp. MKU1]KRW93331.1 sugar ABC transporter [Paracoccus sp. MKU1]
MERSRINRIMAEAAELIAKAGFHLPPFAHWSPEEFRARATPAIRDGRLGWDITDYGQGDFDRLGLFLFTLRNGRLADLQAGRGMVYAEKLLISQENQISPMHTHVIKTEDIINRCGATLAIRLCGSDAQGRMDRNAPCRVDCDGIPRQIAPGGVLRLSPGESVTLRPGDWHEFWAEGGPVLIGEVSTVNDDLTDNIFAAPIGRFANIVEDEAPLHLLVSDYDSDAT